MILPSGGGVKGALTRWSRRGRRMARRVGRIPQRLLHPLRRRAAAALLRSGRAPGVVLVVCHGNICRSPYAAGALRRRLPAAFAAAVRVDSAGFVGPHRGAPPEAIQVAAGRGVDLSGHRSKLLTPQMVAGADLIVVMEARQATTIAGFYRRARRDILVLGDLDPWPIETRTIRDPFEQPAEVFEASYARIDRCLDELVRLAWRAG